MKIEQSQFLSDKPYRQLRSEFYDQDALEDRIRTIVITLMVPTLSVYVTTIAANLLFLLLAALSIMSQPQMVPLAYGNHTITIEHELHAPVYVYLLHDHKTKDLTMGDPCEHRLNGVCVSSTHAKLYNHEQFQIVGVTIKRGQLHDSDLLDAMSEKYNSVEEDYLSWNIISDENELLMYYGIIETNLKVGKYTLRTSQRDGTNVQQALASVQLPTIQLHEFGLFGSAGMLFPALNWVFFIIMFMDLALIVTQSCKVRRARLNL